MSTNAARSLRSLRSVRRLARVGAALALLVLLSGCLAGAAPPTRVVSGHYAWGFEESSLVACGSDETWWVVDDAPLVAAHRASGAAEYEPVFVRVRGALSPPGSYGHLGDYDREFRLTDVVEVRPAGDVAADCRGR